MKIRVFLAIAIAATAACASSKLQRPLLTISDAHRLAVVDREREVMVVGYFHYHHEGCGLMPTPGEASEDGLLLRWIKTPALQPSQHVRLFHGKFVEVSGVLTKGLFLGPRTPEVPVLWVLSIKVANKSPEPTPTAVTPRAVDMKTESKQIKSESNEARVAPAVVVAHL